MERRVYCFDMTIPLEREDVTGLLARLGFEMIRFHGKQGNPDNPISQYVHRRQSIDCVALLYGPGHTPEGRYCSIEFISLSADVNNRVAGALKEARPDLKEVK